jgi:hypothetical protein
MSVLKTFPLLMVTLLSACVYTAKTREIYDANCQIYSRHMALEHTEVTSLGICRNTTECVGILVIAGAVTAASAIIAGSIVVTGNTVYWLEKQGRCVRVSTPAPPLPAASGM